MGLPRAPPGITGELRRRETWLIQYPRIGLRTVILLCNVAPAIVKAGSEGQYPVIKDDTMTKLITAAGFCALLWAAAALAANPLQQSFRTPPDSVRPWVYWFWLNGNLTKEGITADLEAMRRVGIGGVLIMEVDQGCRKGPFPSAAPSGANSLDMSARRPTGSGWR